MRSSILIATLLLISCSGPEIQFPIGNSAVVVEGWITTEEKQHWVKLSRTVGFQNSQSETPIEDAFVTIEDNVTSYALTHSGNGIYLTDSFTGTIGRQYTLNVELGDGDIIISSGERLNSVPDIDNLAFDSFIEADPETGEDLEIYYPIVTTNDPVDQTNHYRFIGFRNDELLNTPDELEILSDRFINGKVLPHNIPSFRYDLTDIARIEVHSLSKNGFDFLELLKSQTTSLGSSSGTSPATFIGNLTYDSKSDIVLGFFGASDVKSISSSVQ